MKYQDELESGKRQLRSGKAISQQVEDYRHKLLQKVKRLLLSLRFYWTFIYFIITCTVLVLLHGTKCFN